MAILVFPTTALTVYEDQYFVSRHFIATTAVTLLSYSITTSASPCSSNFAANVAVQISGSSLTISGRYQNIFIDTEYKNRNTKPVSSLSVYTAIEAMPNEYYAAVQYKPDMRDSINVNIEIVTDFGTTSLSQIVRNDWNHKRNRLLDWVYADEVDQFSIRRDLLLPLPANIDSGLAETYSTSITYSVVGSGFFTVPAGVFFITVEALGAGGGGGSGNENNWEHGGGGGGSGGFQKTDLFVQPGSIIAWQVGAGGAGMPGSRTGVASPGGDTYFGSIISTGGAGGTAETGDGVNNGAFFGKGGAGGTPNGITGANGTVGNGGANGGKGADSPVGTGTIAPYGTGGAGGGQSNGVAGYGGSATGFGAGGGGGGANDVTGTPNPTPGGDGAPGWLKITYAAIS